MLQTSITNMSPHMSAGPGRVSRRTTFHNAETFKNCAFVARVPLLMTVHMVHHGSGLCTALTHCSLEVTAVTSKLDLAFAILFSEDLLNKQF